MNPFLRGAYGLTASFPGFGGAVTPSVTWNKLTDASPVTFDPNHSSLFVGSSSYALDYTTGSGLANAYPPLSLLLAQRMGGEVVGTLDELNGTGTGTKSANSGSTPTLPGAGYFIDNESFSASVSTEVGQRFASLTSGRRSAVVHALFAGNSSTGASPIAEVVTGADNVVSNVLNNDYIFAAKYTQTGEAHTGAIASATNGSGGPVWAFTQEASMILCRRFPNRAFHLNLLFLPNFLTTSDANDLDFQRYGMIPSSMCADATHWNEDARVWAEFKGLGYFAMCKKAGFPCLLPQMINSTLSTNQTDGGKVCDIPVHPSIGSIDGTETFTVDNSEFVAVYNAASMTKLELKRKASGAASLLDGYYDLKITVTKTVTLKASQGAISLTVADIPFRVRLGKITGTNTYNCRPKSQGLTKPYPRSAAFDTQKAFIAFAVSPQSGFGGVAYFIANGAVSSRGGFNLSLSSSSARLTGLFRDSTGSNVVNFSNAGGTTTNQIDTSQAGIWWQCLSIDLTSGGLGVWTFRVKPDGTINTPVQLTTGTVVPGTMRLFPAENPTANANTSVFQRFLYQQKPGTEASYASGGYAMTGGFPNGDVHCLYICGNDAPDVTTLAKAQAVADLIMDRGVTNRSRLNTDRGGGVTAGFLTSTAGRALVHFEGPAPSWPLNLAYYNGHIAAQSLTEDDWYDYHPTEREVMLSVAN